MSAGVVVVGSGPAGLVAAITLARYGVPTLVLEKRAGTSPFPRATGISLRTMEIFRSWGLDPAIRAGDMNVSNSGIVCPTLSDAGRGFEVSLGFASAPDSARLSPTAPVAAPQDFLEPILLEHLRTYPEVEIRFGAEVIGIDQDATSVTLTVREGSGLTRVECAYVIGADGAHSTVRAGVGIDLVGPDNLASHYTTMFRAPLAEVVAERRHGLYMITHPEAAGVFLPTDPVDRWVYAHQWDPTVDSPPSTAALIERIRLGAGVRDLPVTIVRTGSFPFAAQLATRYREGRVFLVGDAAHRMTPRGGTGMNTAIHDAHDLGWRLGWGYRGWATDGLLDGYEPSRRPVGERNVARSAHEGPRDTSADHLDDLGGRIPHHWVTPTVSTLDLVSPGLTLLTGPCGRSWSQAATALTACVPVTVRGVGEEAAAALGLARDGAVLVDPDAMAVRTWPTAAPDELIPTVREFCSPAPIPV